MNWYDYGESRRAKDKAFILDPDRWPRWPWLPMKRVGLKGTNMETGGFYADDSDAKSGVRLFKYNSSEVFKTYKNIDELQADGWVVD